MTVSGLKASTILNCFLDLRSASAGWCMPFSIYPGELGSAMVATFAVCCSIAPSRCAILRGDDPGLK
ncbi:MAG TPA: hypothetical protein VIQ05_30075 [Tardiphaga sp.]